MASDIILTREGLSEVVSYFMEFDAFAFDTESIGDHRLIPAKNELTWISLATHGRAVAIPFGHPNGYKLITKATRKKNPVTKKFDPIPAVFSPPPDQLRPSEVFSALRPLFFSGRRKIGANLSFDLVSVWKYFGELPPPPYSDIIVKQWLLNENFEAYVRNEKTGKKYFVPKKGLKYLNEHYFGYKYDTEEVGKDIRKHTFGTVGRYSYLDAKATWLLDKHLTEKMKGEDLDGVLNLEEEIICVVCRMADTGAYVNRSSFERLQTSFVEKLVSAEASIYRAAGKKFDIGSVPQKQQILYSPKRSGGQGLKPIKLTPAGKKKKSAGKELSVSDYSTDKDALEPHLNNPVVEALAEHAVIQTLNGYLKSYLGDAENPSIIFDGRIHAQFKQYGTVTGRFSSSDPNLQNIPAHGEFGKEFRACFEVPEGLMMVVGDYGQIELRVLASYIGHGRLYDGFWAGVDAHTATAAAVFGVEFDAVTPEMRQVAKGLNFAIVYGAGAPKVASMAKISVAEAKRFLELHRKMFPEIHAFIDRVVERCREREIPHIRTLSGQFRRLPEITRSGALAAARRTFGGEKYTAKELDSRVWSIQSKAERQAVNSLIQGSAASLIKYAMVRVDKAFEEDYARHRDPAQRIRLSMTVHDELVAIAPEARAEDAKRMLQEAMLGEGVQKMIRVPLTSDVKIARRWSEAK